MLKINRTQIRGNKTLSAIVLVLILTFSAASMLLGQKNATANAQTGSTVVSNLQYEWTSPNADPTNTYYSDGPGPAAPNLEWSLTIPGLADQAFQYSSSTLTAFNGMLFFSQGSVGTFPGMIAAVDAFTGKIVWKMDRTSGACVKLDNTYMMRGSTCVKIADGSTVWTPPSGFSGTYVPELKMFVGTTTGWHLPDPSQPPTLAWNRSSLQNVHPGSATYGDGKVFIYRDLYIFQHGSV
ncbi:MAG: hypothetical protein V1754_01655, partial [Pseudomonadota bacterium]